MSELLERKRAFKEKMNSIFGVDPNGEPEENEYTRFIDSIYQQYPGVPDPYPLIWDRSDTNLPQNDEWNGMLRSTAEALRKAADVCDQLAAKTERTQRHLLIANKDTLLCAVHKAEDVVDQLGFKYPLDTLRNYKIAKANPEIAPRIPEILINNDERVLVWMPRIPSKRRGVDSMVFQELQEMLWDTQFAHFNKWHCDFIHVYSREDLEGIYDVDNYAYKPIIDAFVCALRTRDNFDHFSFSMYNYCSETLKKGCFIHVYKRDEKVAVFQKIEELMKGKNQG